MNVDVVVVKCDDWQGIYLNGDLAEEGHMLRLDEIGNLLVGKTIKSFRSYWFEYEEYAEIEPYWDSLPQSLDSLRPLLAGGSA